MDGADEVSLVNPEADGRGDVDSERPTPEGSDATQMEDLPSAELVNESPRAAVEGEKLSGERDQGVRRGSSGRDRSRHSSGTSDTSRRRKSSRHRSKQDDGTSASGTRSQNRSSSLHSRTKSHKPKDPVDIINKRDTNEDNTTDDEANAVVHVESFTTENETKVHSASSYEEESGKDHKKIAKRSKKLFAEKQKYLAEKQLLKSKMENAKKEFDEEIRNYEKEVDSKRQEMQMQFSDLRVDEQYSALAQRMDELAGFREELDSRFLHCVEYEKEIEEIERYLDRRQELCNSKEEDLRLLDDQLDMLHQELELDKERLERAGFDVANMQPSSRKRKVSSISQKGTETDEDDYILKANLRKCQGDLKKAEASLNKKDLELTEAKEEISVLQADKKKSKEKLKQLETQLSLALSQLKNQTDSGNSPAKGTLNRHASVRSHVSLDPLKLPSDLSINQQAQLNRSLSHDKGTGVSPSGKGGVPLSGKKYISSRKSSTELFAPTVPRSRSSNWQRRGSSYDGIACQDEILEGSRMRPRSMTEGTIKTQPTTVSSACVVM